MSNYKFLSINEVKIGDVISLVSPENNMSLKVAKFKVVSKSNLIMDLVNISTEKSHKIFKYDYNNVYIYI